MSDAIIGAVAEFAAPRHGVISRKRAAQIGLTPWQVADLLRAGLLSEPLRGVLVFRSSAPTWRQSCAVLDAGMRGRGLQSHRASARLHLLDGCRDEVFEVTVHRGRPTLPPNTIIHRVHRWCAEDEVLIDGIRTTGLARTLADLGSVVGADRVLKALDDARRRGVSLNWLQLTAERLHRPGQRGTKVLLTLLDRIRRGDDPLPGSWFERLLEEYLKHPGLPTLVRQYEIRDDRGRVIARPDLAIPELKLGFEAHSRQFHFGQAPEAADEWRDL
ncbi:MAG: hypothetical protein JWL70_601, partial [Acidimicrobiia bacterium]|nr:hypothetical protein [Acidimicrobiia bacterium]